MIAVAVVILVVGGLVCGIVQWRHDTKGRSS